MMILVIWSTFKNNGNIKSIAVSRQPTQVPVEKKIKIVSFKIQEVNDRGSFEAKNKVANEPENTYLAGGWEWNC